MPERVIKAAADVSPLDAFGGKATREHRIRVRSQRSERLQFPAYHKKESAISSAGGLFRPLPATCDASTPRSGDGRSTDARGLRLFPLPGPDAAFPIPQDALLWTYWRSPEFRSWRGLWTVRAPIRESCDN